MSTLQQSAGVHLPSQGRGSRPRVVFNPVTVLGALIAATGIGGAGCALLFGFLDEDPSAIKGIAGYVVMPSLALGGVMLMLVGIVRGAWRQARAAAAAGERPAVHVDLGSRGQVFGIAMFGVIAIGSLSVLGGTTYRAIEFMESTTFCGSCHNVMQPQVQAHLTSPHADVECTKCHIAYRSSPVGPNAAAYVNSKIGGLRQTLAVMTGNYDQPIRAPSDKIPPTNTTCEGCHAPDKNYGVMIRQFTSYAPDELNSRRTRLLAFQVGGGKAGDASAIHWHATAKVWYRAADDLKNVIAWVGVETANGIEEWVNPSVAPATPGAQQLMSCIDCHNRAGHRIPGPDELVDDALDSGRIDPSLPFIKRESVKLLGGDGSGTNPDALAKTFQQSGWFGRLAGFYRDNYPEIAVSKRDAIQAAIGELKKISTQILYPNMSTDWLTYPDNLSHRLPEGIQTLAGQDAPGCFRCHGTLVKSLTGQRLAGTMGGDSCLACHGVGEGSSLQIGKSDPTGSQECALCHVNVEAQQISGAARDGGVAALPTDQLHQR